MWFAILQVQALVVYESAGGARMGSVCLGRSHAVGVTVDAALLDVEPTSETSQDPTSETSEDLDQFLQEKLDSEPAMWQLATENNIHVKRPLGGGAFGKVYAVTLDGDSVEHAMKRMDAEAFLDNSREYEIQQKLASDGASEEYVLPIQKVVVQYPLMKMNRTNLQVRGRSILPSPSDWVLEGAGDPCWGQFGWQPCLNLIMPKVERPLYDVIYTDDDMNPRISRRVKLDPKQRETYDRYSYELASGILAMHSVGYVHNDLKPENVMLDVDGHVKIIDFGFADAKIKPSRSCGTPYYMHPSAVCTTRRPVFSENDWFAFAVMMVELYERTMPFRENAAAGKMRCQPPHPSRPARYEKTHIFEQIQANEAREMSKPLYDLVSHIFTPSGVERNFDEIVTASQWYKSFPADFRSFHL